MAEPREFPNNFPDYAGTTLMNKLGKLDDGISAQLRVQIELLLMRMENEYKTLVDWKDYSVYTGTTGVALLYLHMHLRLDAGTGKDRYLRKAVEYLDVSLKRLRRRGPSFMCGDTGPLAVAAVVYRLLGDLQTSADCLAKLFAECDAACSNPDTPDEVLFGRSGYLLALLFVRHHLGVSVVDVNVIQQVCNKIISSGKEMARKQRTTAPLMYEWHDKKYLGAAHGLSGIFYMLLQVNDAELTPLINEVVKPSVDYMMTLKFASGNYPSSLGSSSGDLLVHWCHGAPGWIHMFALAYKRFGDDKYLDAAKGCADVLWTRGLLRKGYGICHGAAGNAYGFLTMYNLTHDQRYLHRACKFAEWCFDYGKHGCRTPDRPCSLFEGMAGTIYFLVDLLDPAKAKFPAFEM